MDKMKILHLEQSEWATACKVWGASPAVLYDATLGRMALYFDKEALGRVFLARARGGARLWRPEAATRFLASLGMSWHVELGSVSESSETQPGELDDLDNSGPQ